MHVVIVTLEFEKKTNIPSFSFLVQLDSFLKESVRRLNALFLFFTYLLSHFFGMLMATDAFDSVSIFVFQRLFFLYPVNIEHIEKKLVKNPNWRETDQSAIYKGWRS